MWITLLVMAVAVSLEPFRIGMSVLLLNRPRPLLQLSAFLCGGFLMGLTVGAAVLFLLESRAESAHFTLPRVQIAIGVLALLAAAALAVTKGRPRTPPAWLSRLLDGQSLWVAGAAGLGIALPSVDYLAALAVIGTADISSTTRLAALLVFNVVAFALIEIPLLAYLVAPDRTRARLEALNDWVRARGRRGVAVLVAVVGTVLLVAGLAGL
ncbi:GAP family protein [Mycolicibacterium sp. P9-22]|uniref:GAP family protein n=1 Tax=Mycolicibacterium sp. P9-22 TaxID=2024613 RepID=UPI0011EE535C|nr:GAP family protein [Mycolicibacterium sp. P9-22]KAA0110983.1 GAP family protein [Mycolicibacterium sp. P9-22]